MFNPLKYCITDYQPKKTRELKRGKEMTERMINVDVLKEELNKIPQHHFTLLGVLEVLNKCPLWLKTEDNTFSKAPKLNEICEQEPPKIPERFKTEKPQTTIIFNLSKDFIPCEMTARTALLIVEKYCNEHGCLPIAERAGNGKYKFDFERKI